MSLDTRNEPKGNVTCHGPQSDVHRQHRENKQAETSVSHLFELLLAEALFFFLWNDTSAN